MTPIETALASCPNISPEHRFEMFPALREYVRPAFYEHLVLIPPSPDFRVASGMITPAIEVAACYGYDCCLDREFNMIVSFEDSDDADRFADEVDEIELAPIVHIAPVPAFGGTQPRLSIYSRNAISWLSARSWTNATKKADITALKAAKAVCAGNVVDDAARELGDVLERVYGRDNEAVCVTNVACGHSKRSDCFACQLAQAVARRLGFTFRKVFGDRFVSGVSHPKEFSKLPAIEMIEEPMEPMVLVVDDVATSGWHMEEAIGRLRDDGFNAVGAVWISGAVD